MKLLTTAALVSLGIAASSQAATVIASTDFEHADFGTSVTGGFSVTDSDGDYWEAGNNSSNYAGTWNRFDGRALVFGTTAGQYFLINPGGNDGIGTITFQEEQTGFSGGNDIVAEWSTDGSTWNTIETFTPVAGVTSRTITVNQAGDVQVRLTHLGGGHTTMDNISVTDFTAVPEPSSTALLGLGGLSLLLRRRR